MASEKLTRPEKTSDLHNKSDIDEESCGLSPQSLNGAVHHHVIADNLARKLSARQVQMIAIGRS